MVNSLCSNWSDGRSGQQADTLLASLQNVAKDDALSYPAVRQRTYPATVNAHMPTITRFAADSDRVLKVILTALEPRVGLPKGALTALHANGEPHLSGSEARVIFKPATGTPGVAPEGTGEDGKPSAAIGSHTDFGSCESRIRKCKLACVCCG